MTFSQRAVEAACRAWINADSHLESSMRAALTAALAVDGVALQGWQPIESAPRDGTYVLVWRPDEGDAHHEAHAGIDTWTGCSWYRSRLNQQPTHWMPLPQPPAASEGEERE